MMQRSSTNSDSSILKNYKFGDMSCDIDYNTSSKTDVFRDVISLRINQCDPRFPKGASDEQSPASRTG